ncbi:Por secretion system C-terminal sorting domain-containing protein [Flaviramulus basaltis]|uniref:Por secretion system C-terminal sorting domain-containing protein n=1 Tax=Flaviramulus basaltis TaxID=369401 RepID=A0A1K2IRF0_9FLAO|nr:T9SS type A sorting domain-containing protein [Flaviramulus basaltis]SFZ95036.1 Por secretion system C-terminal sorting domain-containing protein [Flaviramulus basaltis]
MKKITFILALLICSLGYSQTTLGYYTEAFVTSTVATQNLQMDAMVTDASFPDTGTDGGSTVMEIKADAGGGTNYQTYLNYPGSPNQDLSSYSYYHLSLKSSSPQATVIRLEDAAGQQANFDPTTYGFVYDGNWYSLVIPFTDISSQNPSFNFADVNNIFLVKSIPGEAASVVISTYLFYVDNVYFSTTSTVLSTKSFESAKISMYPNPAHTEISIASKNKIESVAIYNVTGQKVLSSNKAENLNISSLKSGMYFINAITDGISATSKFIKK